MRNQLKRLRPALLEFVVTMREGACEEQVQSRGRYVKGLDVLYSSHEPDFIYIIYIIIYNSDWYNFELIIHIFINN